MSIEELKNKAEKSWVGCDGCSQDDKNMWISGYLAGTLSNEIELPSDEEIEKKSNEFFPMNDSDTEMTNKAMWKFGAQWVLNHIKQQDNG